MGQKTLVNRVPALKNSRLYSFFRAVDSRTIKSGLS